jgi:hypothetical protein
MSHTNLLYVTVLSFGISAALMKAIVLVPLTFLIPCAKRPGLFANAFPILVGVPVFLAVFGIPVVVQWSYQ